MYICDLNIKNTIMKITITGSLGNISRQLTTQLVQKGHQVTLISHDPQKATTIAAMNATPAIGSLEDADFLTKTFEGADAVYTMVPPLFNTTHYRETVRTIGSHFARAIEKTGVQHVVNLSSIGAHVPEGNGPSSSFYFEEKELYQVSGINLLHLRAGMFYTNFYGNMDMIRNMQIMGNNYDADVQIPLSHPHDIADAATEALNKLSFKGKEIRYVVSDERTGGEIAAALGKAVDIPHLPWITFPDEDLKKGIMQNGFSEHMANLFVELGTSIREGRLFSHYGLHKPGAFGKRKLEDFANEFGYAYRQSAKPATL
jgi:uncharacterized protein YbjT (DUF2867 family)